MRKTAYILAAASLLLVAASTMVDSSQLRLDKRGWVSSLGASSTLRDALTRLAAEFKSRYSYLSGYESAVENATDASLVGLGDFVSSILSGLRINGRNIRTRTLPASRLTPQALQAQHFLPQSIRADELLPDGFVGPERFGDQSVSYDMVAEASLSNRVLRTRSITEAKLASGVIVDRHLTSSVRATFAKYQGAYPGEITFASGGINQMTGWVPLEGNVLIPRGSSGNLGTLQTSDGRTVQNPYKAVCDRITAYCQVYGQTGSANAFRVLTVSPGALQTHSQSIIDNLASLGIELDSSVDLSVFQVPDWTGLYPLGKPIADTKVGTPDPTWHVDHMHKVLSGRKNGRSTTIDQSHGLDVTENPFTTTDPQLTSEDGVNSLSSSDVFSPAHFYVTAYLYTGVFNEKND